MRKKYAENRARKVRQGLAHPNPHKNQYVLAREKRLQQRLHPVLHRISLESLFQEEGATILQTRRTVMKYVRYLCDTNPKLDALAVAWDKMGEARQTKTSLEDLCSQVQLPVPELLAAIVPRAWEMGHQLAKLQVGLAQPTLAKIAISAAKDKKSGFRDRQMLMQAGGIAPSPKGIQIAVNQTNVTNGMPDFDNQTIDLAEAVRTDD